MYHRTCSSTSYPRNVAAAARHYFRSGTVTVTVTVTVAVAVTVAMTTTTTTMPWSSKSLFWERNKAPNRAC